MVHIPRPQQFIRKITKSGKYTHYVVIPKPLLDQLHWRERQKIAVQKYGHGLLVKDWKS